MRPGLALGLRRECLTKKFPQGADIELGQTRQVFINHLSVRLRTLRCVCHSDLQLAISDHLSAFSQVGWVMTHPTTLTLSARSSFLQPSRVACGRQSSAGFPRSRS